MTDGEPAAATGGPKEDSTALPGVDDRIADIRRQRDAALDLGDRETAQEFDALERELYDAGAGAAGAEPGGPGGDATEDMAGAAHAPLTADEAEGVFAFLDTVDADAAAALRAEWGSDVGAHLGYAHLWFTTQYTQAERDSMVVTPGLVRMAARMGRKLAADGQDRSTRTEGGRDVDGAGASPDPAELRRRRQAAQRDGDHRRAQQLDAEERAAWARLSGDAPIVGRAGRKQ